MKGDKKKMVKKAVKKVMDTKKEEAKETKMPAFMKKKSSFPAKPMMPETY